MNVRQAALGVAIGVLALGSAAQAQDLPQINYMSSNDMNCGIYPQYIGNLFGYWKEEGIKVNMLPSDTSVPYVAFLQNGDADIITLDPSQIFQAVDTNLPIKVVYERSQFVPDGIVVVADSPIQSLADLKDMTIGMASDRDLITTIIALDAVGATIEGNNIKTVVVGDSGPVMAKALQEGTIQAFAGGAADRSGIEAAGVLLRNITPAEVTRNPGNSFVVWGPTLEEKRPLIQKFLKGWAKAQLTGVLDTKLVASACKTQVPEQFENLGTGMSLMNNFIYTLQLRRTRNFGELQPDVWAAIQTPYVKLKEISKPLDVASFLDASFIDAANDFTTDEVKKGMNEWKEANRDKLLP